MSDAQDGKPDLLLLATGSEVSLAVEVKKLLDAKGFASRVVSMPCWELFDQQPQSYKDEVLPPAVTARISIEAGATLGWSKYVGDQRARRSVSIISVHPPRQQSSPKLLALRRTPSLNSRSTHSHPLKRRRDL